MPAKKPPRESDSRLPIAGLEVRLLEDFRQRIGYQGAIDREFFEKHVWWWRPLTKLLGEGHTHTEIPSDDVLREHAFPKELFQVIRFAEEMRQIPELIEEWIRHELGPRLRLEIDGTLMLPKVINWPPLVPGSDWRLKMSVDWSRRYVVNRNIQIDFRKHDDDLVAEFRKELKQFRKEFEQQNPFPGIGSRKKKNSYITVSSFTLLENIDEKFFFKRKDSHNELGNARKLVANYSYFFSTWFFDHIPSKPVPGN